MLWWHLWRLRSDEPGVRISAIAALSRVGGPKAFQAIERCVDDRRDMDVRMSALRALGFIGGPGAVACLVSHLADGYDTKVQCAAAAALDQHFTPSLVEAFVSTLALARYPDERVFNVMQAVLSNHRALVIEPLVHELLKPGRSYRAARLLNAIQPTWTTSSDAVAEVSALLVAVAAVRPKPSGVWDPHQQRYFDSSNPFHELRQRLIAIAQTEAIDLVPVEQLEVLASFPDVSWDYLESFAADQTAEVQGVTRTVEYSFETLRSAARGALRRQRRTTV